MPNNAARFRAEHPGKPVVERGRKRIKVRNPDGSITGRFFMRPVHDAAGTELDSDWVPSAGAFDYESAYLDGNVRAFIRRDVSAPPYQIERSDLAGSLLLIPGNLQWRNGDEQLDLVGTPTGTTDPDPGNGAVMRWPDAYGPGIDLQVVPQADGRVVKELIADDFTSFPAPSAAFLAVGNVTLEWQIGFNASNNLDPFVDGLAFTPRNNTTTLIPGGTVEWRTSSGDVFGWFQAPRAWDSEGTAIPVEMRIRRSGPNLTAWLRVPYAGLAAAVGEITIDPTYGPAETQADGDDGYWRDTTPTFSNTGTQLYFIDTYNAFCWFDGVTIANGDTATNSTLELECDTTAGGTGRTHDVYLNDADDAAKPTDWTSSDALVWTTAKVEWGMDGITAGVAYTSPDFSSAVQEVLDRAGWASGQALMVLIDHTSCATLRRFATYNHSTRKAPELTITFTEGATNATATPTTVAATAAVPTPTVTGAASVTPTTVAATTTVPTPSVTTTASVTPTTVAATAAVPTPTVSGTATVTPTTVAATAAVPTPTVTGSVSVTPTTVAATTTVPTPTVTAAASVTPTTVAATATVPIPTVTAGDASVTPTTVAAVAAVPNPTVTAAASATATTVAATATVPTPTVTGAASATATTTTAVAAVPTPTVTATASATATTVAATATVPTPTISTGVNATATATTVAAVAATPKPTITAIGTALTITARENGIFYRNTNSGSFVLVWGFGRSMARGYPSTESWEKVSDRVRFNGTPEGQVAIMESVAIAWANYGSGTTEELKAAIHADLNSAGYRTPAGAVLD